MTVVIVADPPWRFRDALPGETRGATRQYGTMTVDEIASMELPPAVRTAPDAVLFLWRVAAMQQEALDVVAAWGFTVKAEIVWDKLTRKGRRHFGMGRYVRASHEVCLIAVRGKCPPAVRNVRSRFAARVREHSRKPERFYHLVTCMYPSAEKIELFARTSRNGWAQYGNEVGKFGGGSAVENTMPRMRRATCQKDL